MIKQKGRLCARAYSIFKQNKSQNLLTKSFTHRLNNYLNQLYNDFFLRVECQSIVE